MKKLTVIFFLIFIFSVPIITIISPDKKISQIENKILTQFKKPTLENIYNKDFMENFDKYSSDQFPFRESFLKFKNNYSYIVGQREFRNIYVTKNNMLVEKYIFNKDNIDSNLEKINETVDYLKSRNIDSTVSIIPNSIAFYEDELPIYAIFDSQLDSLKYIEDNISGTYYTPFNTLLQNKDKYIYFNGDHHLTQLGSYLIHLDMIQLDYNNLYEKYEIVSDDFYGSYYSKTLLSKINPDKIYSYKNYNNFRIEMDFSDEFDTLYDENKLNSKNQYQYFLHGDPGFAVIYGNENLDKEIMVFKDSYFHNFAPFLTSNYSKIHIVDPRYYDIDLPKYLEENENITECLFFNNLNLLNSEVIY
ncbi:MAG: DHHW family protein [Peptostreptococcaceae bacterium]